MKLSSLEVSSLRNIKHSNFEFLGDVNIFSGPNGSGKSSVLEALHILGAGKSFRSTTIRPVIMRGKKDCTVFGALTNQEGRSVSIGVKKNITGRHQIRINGVDKKSSSSLAKSLPLQIISSSSYGLLEGGPRQRRQFLDWGVFHVEQSFYEDWRKFQRVLKQRNICLRENRSQPHMLEVWDTKLAELSIKLNHSRESYFKELIPFFEKFKSHLLDLPGIELEFFCGWDEDQTIEEITLKNKARDLALGITHAGPHRADLRVNINGTSAGQLLSRGQQKLVIYALKLAQCQLLNTNKGMRCILLIDDLPAEVDLTHQKRLCDILNNLNVQLFLTSICPLGLSRQDWSLKNSVVIFNLLNGEINKISRPKIGPASFSN